MKNTNRFKLATSIALALASTAALAAAPTTMQLPGAGAVVLGSGTTAAGAISNGQQTITLGGNAVINWGAASGVTINATGTPSSQPAGFNIGSGAALTFDGSGGVLNVDVTGNASQIFGKLASSAGNLYVANTNGIIVGPGASISSTAGDVGLIANTLGDTSGFDGTIGAGSAASSVGLDGTGGNVTVNTGASINGTTVLVSGGGMVNVDLSTLTGGATTLSAGLPNAAGGAFATTNPNASLAVSGTQTGGTLDSFASAGNASSSGTLTLDSNAAVADTLTNTGELTLGTGFDIDGALVNNRTVTQSDNVTMGGLTNNGTYDGGNYELATTGDLSNIGEINNVSSINVAGGNLVNGGVINDSGVAFVSDGNFTNNGAMGVGGEVAVENGSIVNNGAITGANIFFTYSNAADPLFTSVADYSITNNGTITSPDYLEFYANGQSEQADTTGTYGILNGSTGSFTNAGALQVAPNEGLEVIANNDISLGGMLQTVSGTTTTAISASNPLDVLYLLAGNYDYSGAFTSDGALTVSTPVAVNGPTFLAGNQVSLLSNVSGNQAGAVDIVAGAQQTGASAYAVRVGTGATVSADSIDVNGDVMGDNPNVLVNGTLSANAITFGDNVAISNLFTGPSGSLSMYNNGVDPDLVLNFIGAVKTVPYNNASNFRFNGLAVDVTDGSPLTVELNPEAYQTNGTSNGLSAVNLLVNSDVILQSDVTAAAAGAPGANGSAVTGVIDLPNTHLVLQSSGSITTQGDGTGDFYWPGYVYLGNVEANADGSAAPGTLGLGTITTDGDFNNVLPGDIGGASGIHFITQFPLTFGGDVITNANAWVNFGSDLLTEAYSDGALSPGVFFGGSQGPGNVVNYPPLATAAFVTQVPSATP